MSLQVSGIYQDQVSFFVALVKPHKSVTSQTLARWMKTILTSAGVDSNIWKPHAVRSAAAAPLKVDKNLQICRLADWSNVSGTFKSFTKDMYSISALSPVCSRQYICIYIH